MQQVLGQFDDVSRRTPSGFGRDADGQAIYLLGETADELDGSEFARLRGHLGGLPPKVDLKKERLLGELLVNMSRDGMIDAAHDVSGGGLAATLSEMVLRFGVGARVVLDEVHAIWSGKRGDLLALGLARLQTFAPTMRRVALSATVRKRPSDSSSRAWASRMSVISTIELTFGYLTLPEASAAGLPGSCLMRNDD